MIDLNKLEENFKNLFEKETEQSFNEWLFDKQKQEAIASLTNKYLYERRQNIVEEYVCIKATIKISKSETIITGNIQFAMAA